MSIVLKDGTVLPDIPASVTSEFPYRLISFVMNSAYGLIVSRSAMKYCAAGEFYPNNSLVITGAPGYIMYFYSPGETDTWTLYKDESGEGLGGAYEAQFALNGFVWSNYDVLDKNGNVYYAKYIGLFILPDGTELPALPEGCFEKYPYGVITKMSGAGADMFFGHDPAYELFLEQSETIVVPMSVSGGENDTIICENSGHIAYLCTGDAWVPDEEVADKLSVALGAILPNTEYASNAELVYSNHDILTATAMNDDGTPEIGPDLYRKSDVNYRIYGGWLNSMGNQARRLGNVSGALKPGEMETVFKAMPPNYGGTPSEVIFFTKQLNPGSSVECPEIPIITDSGGMYIILFNNNDIKGVHSCIYFASSTRFSSTAISEYISLQLVDGKYILNNASTNDRDEIVVFCVIASP